ncbi:MAG: hypothetical protein KAG10_09190 [Methylococcales bacterium]|nr:hypothetical protein [Methylococcales bacterium]MCK5926054.1 hypothetical protein [Methylococcales bacterium]
MTSQQKQNRRNILIIFGMSIIPFCIAWYLSNHPELVTAGKSNGDLVIPVITTERTEMQGFDEFSKKNIKELAGHWLLVNIIPKDTCDKVCVEAIHKTKQLRLMLSKDLTRVRRMVLIFKNPALEIAKNWWKDDQRLLHITPAPSLIKKFETLGEKPLDGGMLFLMDPLGNIMMRYDSGFDPYKVKSDLKKLLRISQIG